MWLATNRRRLRFGKSENFAEFLEMFHANLTEAHLTKCEER